MYVSQLLVNRRFAHEKGCVSVVVKKLDVPVPSYQNSVLMWSWCRKCKQVNVVKIQCNARRVEHG